MIYSVWNQGSCQYDYFEVPTERSTANASAPAHLRPGTLGVTMMHATWPLPVDAVPVGNGPIAQGRIAAPRDGATPVGDVPISTPVTWLAIGIGAAALLRKML